MPRTPSPSRCFSLALPAALALITFVSPLAAQQPEDDRKHTLKGPSVPVETQHTLGSTTMSGEFIPVEGRPELAAFALVTNDPNDLASARDLENKRIFDLTVFLVDEIDAVREITDANQAGNETQAVVLLAQLRKRYEPDLPRDPLAPELEQMLDADQITEFQRIINDYWLRWAAAESGSMNLTPNSRTYKKTEHKLNNQLFHQDIGEAYESSLKRYRNTIDAITTAVQPTKAQQDQIREMIIEHIKQTRLKSTAEQRLDLMTDIYHLFDEDQQETFFRFMTSLAIDRNG